MFRSGFGLTSVPEFLGSVWLSEEESEDPAEGAGERDEVTDAVGAGEGHGDLVEDGLDQDDS